MDAHLKHGIELQQVSVTIEGLPEGMTFEDLHVNQQRLIMASVQQEQILEIQGTKVALLCMRKVSLYDTYEEALAVKNSCAFVDSMIFLPKGYTGAQPVNSPNLALYATIPVSVPNLASVPGTDETDPSQHSHDSCSCSCSCVKEDEVGVCACETHA